MNCYFCQGSVPAKDLHQHHIKPRSEGGTITAPVHKSCHVTYHSSNGHFQYWGSIGGKLSALTRRWAFNLKNVRDDPLYEMDRQYYLLFYARA